MDLNEFNNQLFLIFKNVKFDELLTHNNYKSLIPYLIYNKYLYHNQKETIIIINEFLIYNVNFGCKYIIIYHY